MKVISNFFYTLLNKSTAILIPLITIPYISRVLGPDGIGINSYTSSIVSYFILLGTIGINSYGNRMIAYLRDDKIEMSKLFFSLVVLRFIIVAISLSIFIVFTHFYGKYQNALLMQSILLIASALDISWLFMGMEKFKKIFFRDFAVKVLSLIFVFSFVKNEGDTLIYIGILVLSQLIGNVSLWPYLRKTVCPVPIKSLSITKHIKPSISFFIPQIAIQVYVILNKTMLGSIVGVGAVALYDNAYKICSIILSVVTAIGVVSLPSLTRKFSKNKSGEMNEYFKLIFNFTCFISFPLSAGLLVVSDDFSSLFFGYKFDGISSVIKIMSPNIILISLGIIFGQYFSAIDKIKNLTISVSIGAVSSVLLNIFLINKHGVNGAAFATVVTELIVTLIQIHLMRKHIKLDILKALLAYGIPSVIIMIIGISLPNIDNKIWNLTYKTLSCSVIYLSIMLFLSLILKIEIKSIIKRNLQ